MSKSLLGYGIAGVCLGVLVGVVGGLSAGGKKPQTVTYQAPGRATSPAATSAGIRLVPPGR